MTDRDSAMKGRRVQINTYLQQHMAAKHTTLCVQLYKYQALPVSSFTSVKLYKLERRQTKHSSGETRRVLHIPSSS